MRIKVNEYIQEVKKVWIRDTDIEVNGNFYKTKDDTELIGKQLLEKGYADLSKYERV